MVHFRNIFVPIVAIFFLLLSACHHDSATMQELSRIDSMVYHQGEMEALPLLQKMDTKSYDREEKAYYSVMQMTIFILCMWNCKALWSVGCC